MAYVTVPKDLSKVKSKFILNLTKRQVVCFGGGALIGVPLFFLTKGVIGNTPAAMLMMIAMLPLFLFGVYEKDGMPLEKLLSHIVQTQFIRPKQRPYQTDNFYAAIMQQIQIDKEVRRIVRCKDPNSSA
ncbi:MAG: PrgI family protein [Clostridia bacterium]|nr:PrgI family protein [Clostridia bacterium]